MDLELESHPVVVLAHGRTGTNLLRKILDASDEFQDLGEIFLPGEKRHRSGGFWEFYDTWLRQNSQRLVTTKENRTLLFADYLSALNSLCTAPFMLVDIKYGHVANLNPFHHLSDQKPLLFKLIERYNIPVVHLMRRNLLQQHCSTKLANQTEQWVVPIGDTLNPEEQTIVVEIAGLVETLTRMAMRVQFFDSFLAQYDRYLRLHYEDLLEDGSLADSARQSIGKLLNRLLTIDGTPQTRKISPPLSSLIENFDEVAIALRGTPFEPMLEVGSSNPALRNVPDDIATFGQSTG